MHFTITYPGIGLLFFCSSCALVDLLSDLSYSLASCLLALLDLKCNKKHEHAHERMSMYLPISFGIFPQRRNMEHESISNQSGSRLTYPLGAFRSRHGCLIGWLTVAYKEKKALGISRTSYWYQHAVVASMAKKRKAKLNSNTFTILLGITADILIWSRTAMNIASKDQGPPLPFKGKRAHAQQQERLWIKKALNQCQLTGIRHRLKYQPCHRDASQKEAYFT